MKFFSNIEQLPSVDMGIVQLYNVCETKQYPWHNYNCISYIMVQLSIFWTYLILLF